MPEYFVIRTQQHCEQRAKCALEAKGFDVFLPVATFSRFCARASQLPLFPGFVFVKDTGNGVRLIDDTYGVREVVHVGAEPLRLSADVIARIEHYRDATGCVTLPRLPVTFSGLLASPDGFDLLMRPMRGTMRSLAFVAWLVKHRPVALELAA